MIHPSEDADEGDEGNESAKKGILRGTRVCVDRLGWGIAVSEDVNDEGRLQVHLDIRMRGKRIRAWIHESKIIESAAAPIGTCVKTTSPMGAGILVRYRKEDGIHVIQFPRLNNALGYLPRAAIKGTCSLCPGLAVSTHPKTLTHYCGGSSRTCGIVLRRAPVCGQHRMWMVKLPYGIGIFHEDALVRDARSVPIVFRAIEKYRGKRKRAMAMMRKLHTFAEQAGLLPEELSANSIQALAQEKIKEAGELVGSVVGSATTGVEGRMSECSFSKNVVGLEDTNSGVLARGLGTGSTASPSGDDAAFFFDCAETEEELEQYIWEDCIEENDDVHAQNNIGLEKVARIVLQDEAKKIQQEAEKVWGKIADVAKDDRDVKRLMEKVDAKSEHLAKLKIQAEETWASSSVGAVVTSGASRLQDKMLKLQVAHPTEDGHAVGLTEIQDNFQNRFGRFLNKVQAKEEVLKNKGAKLFSTLQRRLLDGEGGWLQTTKQKVIDYFELESTNFLGFMKQDDGEYDGGINTHKVKKTPGSSITAAITAGVVQWVSVACEPGESAAEILDRWERRDAGDILEGIDLVGTLQRAGVVIPAPIAKMLETYMKEATSTALGPDGFARGEKGDRSKQALTKVLENEVVKSSAEAAIEWGDVLLGKAGDLTKNPLAQKLLAGVMESDGSRGDEIMQTFENLDMDLVFDQAESAYRDFHDPEARAKLIDETVDKALDVLMKLLPSIKIDSLAGETPDVTYNIQNIDLGGFGIKKDEVALTLGDFADARKELISFEASGLSCVFENLRFGFAQKRFPYVSGNGVAYAEAKDISLCLGFTCKWIRGIPNLILTRKETTVGELSLSFSESKLSWVLNIISSLFQSIIISYVCDTIVKQIENHIGEVTNALDTLLSHEMIKPMLESLKPPDDTMIDEVASEDARPETPTSNARRSDGKKPDKTTTTLLKPESGSKKKKPSRREEDGACPSSSSTALAPPEGEGNRTTKKKEPFWNRGKRKRNKEAKSGDDGGVEGNFGPGTASELEFDSVSSPRSRSHAASGSSSTSATPQITIFGPVSYDDYYVQTPMSSPREANMPRAHEMSGGEHTPFSSDMYADDDDFPLRCTTPQLLSEVTGSVGGWWQQRKHTRMVQQVAEEIVDVAISEAVEMSKITPEEALQALVDEKMVPAPSLEKCIDRCFKRSRGMLMDAETTKALLEAKFELQQKSMRYRWEPLPKETLSQVAKALHLAVGKKSVDVDHVISSLRGAHGSRDEPNELITHGIIPKPEPYTSPRSAPSSGAAPGFSSTGTGLFDGFGVSATRQQQGDIQGRNLSTWPFDAHEREDKESGRQERGGEQERPRPRRRRRSGGGGAAAGSGGKERIVLLWPTPASSGSDPRVDGTEPSAGASSSSVLPPRSQQQQQTPTSNLGAAAAAAADSKDNKFRRALRSVKLKMMPPQYKARVGGDGTDRWNDDVLYTAVGDTVVEGPGVVLDVSLVESAIDQQFEDLNKILLKYNELRNGAGRSDSLEKKSRSPVASALKTRLTSNGKNTASSSTSTPPVATNVEASPTEASTPMRGDFPECEIDTGKMLSMILQKLLRAKLRAQEMVSCHEPIDEDMARMLGDTLEVSRLWIARAEAECEDMLVEKRKRQL